MPPPRPAPSGRLPPPRPVAATPSAGSGEKRTPPPRPVAGATPPAMPRRPSNDALIATERRLSQRLSARNLDINELLAEQAAASEQPPPAAAPRAPSSARAAVPPPRTTSGAAPPPRPAQTRAAPPDEQENGVAAAPQPPRMAPKSVEPAPRAPAMEAPKKPQSRIPQQVEQNDFDDGVVVEGGFMFREELPPAKSHSGRKREYMSSYTTMGRATTIVERNTVWNPTF